jgi:hypothetical protein
VALGPHVAALDPLREFDLLRGCEQLDGADRAQVEAEAIEARLNREIELLLLLVLLVRGHPVSRDHVDPLLDQVGVQPGDLLLGDLDLLQRRGDLLEGQVATFGALGDQPPQLLAVGKGLLLCRNRLPDARQLLSQSPTSLPIHPDLSPNTGRRR